MLKIEGITELRGRVGPVLSTGFIVIVTAGKAGLPAWGKLFFEGLRASDVQKSQHPNRLATTGAITCPSATLVVCDSVAFQVIDGIFDGADIPSLIVGDFHLFFIRGELLFEGHD